LLNSLLLLEFPTSVDIKLRVKIVCNKLTILAIAC